MSMFGGMEISATALTAQRLRMNVTAENLANADDHQGRRRQPYRRKEVVLQSVADGGFGAALNRAIGSGSGTVAAGGVQVAAVTEDQTPGKMVYDPSHPDANADGLRADAQRRHGHRDGRPDRCAARL